MKKLDIDTIDENTEFSFDTKTMLTKDGENIAVMIPVSELEKMEKAINSANLTLSLKSNRLKPRTQSKKATDPGISIHKTNRRYIVKQETKLDTDS